MATRHSTRTLDGARYFLTVKNTIQRYAATGPWTPGTAVLCLRPNSFGIYGPCVATIVKRLPSGRVTVDLWANRSDRVTVTPKAILWSL